MSPPRRQVIPPPIAGLAPDVVEILITGTCAADPFRFFDIDAELPALWREHRDALRIEAARRGLACAWAERFEGAAR